MLFYIAAGLDGLCPGFLIWVQISDLIFSISDIAINTPSVKIWFCRVGSTLHFDQKSSTLRNCLFTLIEQMSKIHAWIYILLFL